MSSLLALVLATTGFAALAAVMHRYRALLPLGAASARQRLIARGAGVLALAASFAVCVTDAGRWTGSVLWLGLLTVGTLAVVCTVTWRARWLRPLARLIRLV